MDELLDAFMDIGPTVAPEHIAQATRLEIRNTKQGRPFWPARRYTEMSTLARLATAAAAVAVIVVVAATFILGGKDVGVDSTSTPSPSSTVPSPTGTGPAPSGDVGSLPGEFTACIPSNAPLVTGTDEETVVPHPEGDMTLQRRRGFTWAGDITATDARFSGRHYYSWDANQYTLASGDEGPTVYAEGHRIENDEGAWQGSATGASLPDGTQQGSAVFLTGEGAYEGLTAVLFDTEGPCFGNYTGLLIEFPDPPPVPSTGE